MKTSIEIRSDFINFFKKRKHTFVASSPVVPADDPTLLFTNAGMNQFKDVFLNLGSRPYLRAVNSQKCIRVSGKHNDLEEVGIDTYHHTFFEMLGNWSFGDYYKNEAIKWAWELLTAEWNLPKDKLWATVFEEDDEAAILWEKVTDIAPEKILRSGAKDNFWEMGETGPCGPCSEIHIDLGEHYCDKKFSPSHVCRVNGDCARFIELWNLVFIQYNRDDQGNLHLLPAKHVDTGMGFERIVAVLQHVHSNYDTDLFSMILQEIGQLANLDYTLAIEDQRIAFRVIADHLRMLVFSITDGALPSNEGRGYVLRRILRRAARFGRKVDLHKPFLFKLVPTVVDVMKDAFPEIEKKQHHVKEVIKSEEENFNRTLDRGIELFEELAVRLVKEGKKVIPGEEAFRLYDTYGFPLDLTRVMSKEKNMIIDEDGFDREMEAQRERARNAGKFVYQFDHMDNWNVLKHCSSNSQFVGYESIETKTQICKYAHKNGNYHIVLTETPFYPESGGQIADQGSLILDKIELKVIDVQKQGNEIIHICEGPTDLKIIHSEILAKVNWDRRLPTMYNHTATHLLHAALRKVLGPHVQQAGSLVDPERLRFDFTHFKKIEQQELEEIEQIINNQIRLDHQVEISYTSFDEAQKKGAMALFGEKYENEVRVVKINEFSMELCGGTHVSRIGEIGSFFIIHETAIASGIRRIEAITGPEFIKYAQNNRSIINLLVKQLNVTIPEIPQRVNFLNNQIKDLEKDLHKIQTNQVVENIDDLIQKEEKIGSVKLVVHNFYNTDMESLKKVADLFRQQADNGIILLINSTENKLNFVCAITDDLIKNKNLNAGELIRQVAKITGGSGGGRAHLATAGGKEISKLNDAIHHLKQLLMKI
jgi:alanyl-tRNA synthetase